MGWPAWGGLYGVAYIWWHTWGDIISAYPPHFPLTTVAPCIGLGYSHIGTSKRLCSGSYCMAVRSCSIYSIPGAS